VASGPRDLAVASCGDDTSTAEENVDVEVKETSFDSGTTMAKLSEAGKIVIGVKIDQPGIGFQQAGDDTPTGFDIEIGRILAAEATRDAASATQKAEYDAAKDTKDGSIIVILATDAPLHPVQLQRLAKRATVGLARVGGYGHNPSGDIFLAFSTGNEVPVQTVTGQRRSVDPFKARALDARFVDDQSINGLLEAAADATEEAIYNALCGAETMTGNRGRRVEALPLGRVREIMGRYHDVERACLAGDGE